MPHRPTILFYEANDFRFYGAGRVLLWLLERLQEVKPLYAAPGAGVLTQRVGAAGIESAVLPLPRAWRTLDRRRGRAARLGKGLLSPALAAHTLRLAQLIRARDVQGVHANSTRAALYAGFAARLAGVPLWWHLRLERPPGWSERLAYRLSDRVICVSTAVAQRLALGDKAVTILDGVPLARMRDGADGAALRARFGWDEEALVVGDVASLSPRKRHDLFIHMAQRLASQFPQARFLICGHLPPGAPPAHEQTLRALAGDLLASGRLAMAGHVEDMAAAYAAMDLLVFPSDVEGFGLVAVEAMLMGVPVVRTDTAGARDMIVPGETGLLVPPGDLDALTAAACDLLRRPELRARLGRAGKDLARARFTAERMAGEVEALMLARIGARGG